MMERTKEIHFYKDDYIDSFAYDVLETTHNETESCIKLDCLQIYTTAISCLDFSWLLEKGYKIFLHENDKCLEIKEGCIEGIDKEIKIGHNIMKLWIGGTFDNYFYNYN